MKEFAYTLNDIHSFMPHLWPFLKEYKILALHGALGAGKTTFTTALCTFLGVEETPGSPTFSLINQYSFTDEKGRKQVIFHSDWYRIRNEDEAINAGIEDMLYDDYAFCIVEWPEKAAQLLPENTLHLYFEVEGITQRKIRLVENKIS